MPEPKARIAVVDDDAAVVDLLVEILSKQYDVHGFTSAAAALERVTTSEVDLLVADVEMPEMRGLDLTRAVLERKPSQLVLLITAFGSIELAVQALKLGACDFVTKPFPNEVLVVAIERALRERKMRREIVRLRRDLEGGGGDLIARSPAMRRVLEIASRAARSDATVLITGESGVGKGAVARWIHEHSPRNHGPLLQVNCAALPAGLIESELFGVRRGAFTDARESRDGLFAEASGGTIFLDEIAEMSLDAQSKLLSVLETGRVRPVGGASEINVDARVIAATNQRIEDAVAAKTFRTDLYYRLNVIPIEIPPLRDRREDIPELVTTFLGRATKGAQSPIGIAEDAMRWLTRYDWPGNVRELANVVERAVALTEHDTLVGEDFVDLQRGRATDAVHEALDKAAERQLSLAEVELGYIKRVVERVGGNMSHAARVLGIDRRTLYRKLAGSV